MQENQNSEAITEEEITFDAHDDEGTIEEAESPRLLVDELQKERDDYYDQLLRKQAEFDNYRKRVKRERTELRSKAHAEVIKELLVVIDSAEKGLESLVDAEDPAMDGYREGYQLIVKSLHSLLERFHVTPVPAVGEKFDPNVHEAVVREFSDELEDGQILEEFRKGYQIEDRLLRPSQVKVAVASSEASSN